MTATANRRWLLSCYCLLIVVCAVGAARCAGAIETGQSADGCSAARQVVDSVTNGLTSQVTPEVHQLFIDDSVIANLTNAVRTYHSPTKVGVVLRPDQKWERGSIQIRSAPVWSREERRWKLWYYHFGVPLTGMAVSEDGVRWTKPALGKRDYEGSRENNLVALVPAVESGSEGIIMNIVYDPDDDHPDRRYKGMSGRDHERRPVFSRDGITWSRPELPSIPSYDESNLFYDSKSHLFIATVKQNGPHGRSVFLSLSRDFERWTDPRNCLIFHTDERDQELGKERIVARMQSAVLQKPEYNVPDTYNVDVYNMAVVRYQGIYLGFPALFHQTGRVPGNWPGFEKLTTSISMLESLHRYGDWTGFHNIELVFSRNLIDWQRTSSRHPFLENSPPGDDALDLQTMLFTSPVVRDDQLWFYYTGLKRYATIASGDEVQDNGGICLARLRLDGFASIVGGSTPGFVTTKPFHLNGSNIYVNYKAAGNIRAEIVDPDSGKPLQGFSFVDCRELSGDSVNGNVQWTGGSVAELRDKTIKLRFRLEDADLYSFWFK